MNNHQLDVFRKLYSHHPLRTAGNKSPLQLWVSGFSEESSDNRALQGLLQEPLVKEYIDDFNYSYKYKFLVGLLTIIIRRFDPY